MKLVISWSHYVEFEGGENYVKCIELASAEQFYVDFMAALEAKVDYLNAPRDPKIDYRFVIIDHEFKVHGINFNVHHFIFNEGGKEVIIEADLPKIEELSEWFSRVQLES